MVERGRGGGFTTWDVQSCKPHLVQSKLRSGRSDVALNEPPQTAAALIAIITVVIAPASRFITAAA